MFDKIFTIFGKKKTEQPQNSGQINQNLQNLIKDALTEDNVSTLSKLVAIHGVPAIRMEDNPDELTTLHWAAAFGALKSVDYLMSNTVQADPRATRGNNFTPLHSAAMNGHAAICQALLDAGAEINVQTEPQGYAPLHSAAFGGHIKAIKVLLSHRANCKLRNYRDEQPADTAKRQGQTKAAQLLEAN